MIRIWNSIFHHFFCHIAPRLWLATCNWLVSYQILKWLDPVGILTKFFAVWYNIDFFLNDTILPLPMLRLLSSKAHGCNDFWKTPKPCHVGIHWIALAEYSQMSTHMPGFFESSFVFLHQISHQQHEGYYRCTLLVYILKLVMSIASLTIIENLFP